MRGLIYPRGDDDPCLRPKEVAKRWACEIPCILIDWHRGDERVQSKLEELIDMEAPEAILNAHKNYFGNTLFFRAEFPDVSLQSVQGWVLIDDVIEIECEFSVEMELLQHASKTLADALDYDFEVTEAGVE